MKVKTFWAASVLFITLVMATISLHASTTNPAVQGARLLSAESVGTGTFDDFMEGLQKNIASYDESDQIDLNKVWRWVLFVLRDILGVTREVDFVKITYTTTTASGEPITVSGLAILPRATSKFTTTPILSMQHPTETERKYSPSRFNMKNMWDDEEMTVPFAYLFAQAGFAVVLADYPGMGDNTDVHPYCTESIANSVVDMIRAGRDCMALPGSPYAQWDGRLYLAGFSEGGYATLVSSRDIQNHCAGEFTVSGSAGLDGPYSLSDTMRGVMLNSGPTFDSPYFLPFVVAGYDSVYAAKDPIFDFFKSVKTSVPTDPNFAMDLYRMVIEGIVDPDDINDLMKKATPYEGPHSILTDAYVKALKDTTSVVCQTLEQNNAYYNWTPGMPMRLYHYPKDDLVPYGNSTNAYAALARPGSTNVELIKFGDDKWRADYWIIEALYRVFDCYHPAAAPVAYVYSIQWIHSLAYGKHSTTQVAPNDIDGDGISDPVLYREKNGEWQALLSNNPRWPYPGTYFEPGTMPLIRTKLGGRGQIPALKDYDGDGRVDPCVYLPETGSWTVLMSVADYATVTLALGDRDSVPVPQDYDGDLMVDAAVYNEKTGLWTASMLASDRTVTVRLGGPGYEPVIGDFDGDSLGDPCVYRESTGEWAMLMSASGWAPSSFTFSGPGGEPVSGDFDGDGLSDPCVYREKTGEWTVKMSASGGSVSSFALGGPGCTPAVGDYDGDGKVEIATYNVDSGNWAGLMINGSAYMTGHFGSRGFNPMP